MGYRLFSTSRWMASYIFIEIMTNVREHQSTMVNHGLKSTCLNHVFCDPAFQQAFQLLKQSQVPRKHDGLTFLHSTWFIINFLVGGFTHFSQRLIRTIESTGNVYHVVNPIINHPPNYHKLVV